MEIIVVLIGIIIFITLILLIVKSNEIIEDIKQENELLKNKLLILDNKADSIKWNYEVQSHYEKNEKDINYKVNRNIKVLIGDYTLSTASITNKALRNLGIETEFVSSAHDIINKIKDNEKYDAIITNHIYRNNECGEQILNELKKNDRFKTPIVILTVDQNAREMYVEHEGFDEYMAKPLDEKKAIEILPKVIDNLEFIKVK